MRVRRLVVTLTWEAWMMSHSRRTVREADNAKLRAALEAAAAELNCVAGIASTVTSGKAANAINAVRIIKETALEAERACWVVLKP